MELLALIPARSGSKGLQKKNIADLCGKPLISWSIESALSSDSISRTIVTTDHEDIARVSSEYGAEIPFLRPPELAMDDTPGLDPVFHAINWLNRVENYKPDVVIVLQPTSPLRTSEDIENAISLFNKKEIGSVVSVVPVDHHPYWMKSIDKEGRMSDFCNGAKKISERQKLPPAFSLNGAIYISNCENLMKHGNWYYSETHAYVMPVERSIDIDTAFDLFIAEKILESQSNRI